MEEEVVPQIHSKTTNLPRGGYDDIEYPISSCRLASSIQRKDYLMRTSGKMITMSSSELTRGDDLVNNNATSGSVSMMNTSEDSALRQCYAILEKGEGSPRYLSLVAIAIEEWNSVCEWEGE